MAPFEELQALWQKQQPPAARGPDGTALTRELHRYGRRRNLISVVKAVLVSGLVWWMIDRLHRRPLTLAGALWVSAAAVVFLILDWRRQYAIAHLNFTEPSLGFVRHAMAQLREDGELFRKQFQLLVLNAAIGINVIYLGTLGGSASHRIYTHLVGTAVALAAWRLGRWVREKRVEGERRPLLAQLTAMARAFEEGTE